MNKERNCKWTFRKFVDGDDKLQGANDPIIQKYKEDFFNSLVRESIQNSMDAKADGQDHVEITFSLNAISANDYPELFNLQRHIAACLETHKEDARARETYTPMAKFLDADTVDVLTVSDFLTKGMPFHPENIYKNPFAAFVNSDGQSVKNKVGDNGAKRSNGGSFGIGKGAYFLMSPVRSLLVSTMVDDLEKHTYFEGVARLCTHDLNGEHYYHMGFYCEDGKNPVSGDDIPEDFRREQPGTSISLVGKYADLGNRSEIEDSIERAVISNFWLALYEKKLTVTVGQRKRITNLTLEDKMNALFNSIYLRNNPYLFYLAYSSTEDKRQYFRFQLTDDELLGNCELRLRIGETGKPDQITYMRDPMMLIQTKVSPKQRHAGIKATFLCIGEPGNSNLELTEDESHTSWSASGKSGEAKKKAKSVLDRIDSFITDSIESIMGGKSETIDVSIDRLSPNDDEMKSIEAQEGAGGNPFGAVKEKGKSLENGFDRFSVPLNTQEQEENQKKGNIVTGPLIMGKKDGGGTTPDGPVGGKPRVRKGDHPKPGKGRKAATVGAGDEKIYRIIPADFAVAVHKNNGRWVHTLWVLPSDEPFEREGRACLDLSVGADSSNDITVPIEKVVIAGKEAEVSGSRIILDNLPTESITMDIIFADNLRHSINLK